ncbi:MAG: acyl-CoA dehydrogenase family protein [Dehalococcoidia bacterium]
MVDFTDTAEEAAFRKEVQEFIEANSPRRDGEGAGFGFGGGGANADARKAFEAWRDALVERGWIAPHWPEEYGGAGLTVKEQFILNQELAEAGTGNVGGFGTMMLGPTLIIHGTEEQKAEHLSAILKGEVNWCQGWSEPGAGSDLASLQTRAVRDGDDWVINGQKIWTSGAQFADSMYMLARTDPDAPKHRGISFFLLDMKAPGVTVRPLEQMSGGRGFNEVFFEDVRVSQTNMIGEENRGWYVGATLMDYERSGIGNSVGTQRRLSRLLNTAKELPEEQSMLNRNNHVRLAFADRFTDASVALLFSQRIMTMQAKSQVPNHEASAAKLFSSEMGQRIAALNIKLFGLYGNLNDPDREEAQKGAASRGYVQAVSSTIAGGTSEIQRNVIATRGLGLPRG